MKRSSPFIIWMNNPCNAPWLQTCVTFDLNSTYSSIGKPWNVLRLSFWVNIWKELTCEQKVVERQSSNGAFVAIAFTPSTHGKNFKQAPLPKAYPDHQRSLTDCMLLRPYYLILLTAISSWSNWLVNSAGYWWDIWCRSPDVSEAAVS